MGAPLPFDLPLVTLAGALVAAAVFAVSHSPTKVALLVLACGLSCWFLARGLVLAGRVTAHAPVTAADRVGGPFRQAIREDLAREVEQVHLSGEDNLG